MNKKLPEPHEVGRYFFQALMHNKCNECWNLFSDHTQKEFISWTLKDLYEHHREAAQTAKLGAPEVKLMFETNNLDLILRFWRRFVRQSRATDFFRYGYFNTISNNQKEATVEVRFIYPDGREMKTEFKMVVQRGGWRFAYLESGLGF